MTLDQQNTAYKEFKLSKDFSLSPGPGLIDEGEFSGELFRKNYLLPLIKEAISQRIKLKVDLDGTYGYASAFLEEAFAGLIREDHISFRDIKQYLEIISTEEPYLIEDIDQYLLEEYNCYRGCFINEESKMKQGDKPKSTDPKDQGLIVEIVDGKLVISVGVNILAFACEFGNPDNSNDAFKITNADDFAKEIMYILLAEEENGTTLVHKMLDTATNQALDQGCLGIEFN